MLEKVYPPARGDEALYSVPGMATLSRRQCIACGAAVAASGVVAMIGRKQHAVSLEANAAPQREGVFVWTRADADLVARARATQPLAAAVHVATVAHEGSGYAYRRALSPLVGGQQAPITLVVRFDDSVHSAWGESPVRKQTVESIAASLAVPLDRIVRESRATGAKIDEILLDYDAPMRALSAWAAVVGLLSRGVLAGMETWVTSLPAHLDDAAYGELFASSVAGHVIQLFDTGLACTPEAATRLSTNLERHRIPFRVAVSGFERARAEPFTSVCWQMVARGWSALPRYAGFWIFPAGHDVASSLRRMTQRADGELAVAPAAAAHGAEP